MSRIDLYKQLETQDPECCDFLRSLPGLARFLRNLETADSSQIEILNYMINFFEEECHPNTQKYKFE